MPVQVQGSDKTKLEVHDSVRAQLRVMVSYNIKREVHSSATAGARQRQNGVRSAWQCQSTVKGKE